MTSSPRPRSVRSHLADDSGSAAIEFIFASLILLVPLVYVLLSLSQVQAGAYASNAVAIQASRAAAMYPEHAQDYAEEIVDLAKADYGIEDADLAVAFSCTESCDTAGALVTATVTTRIPFLGLPAIFGDGGGGRITVHSSHSDVVGPVGDRSDEAAPGDVGTVPALTEEVTP